VDEDLSLLDKLGRVWQLSDYVVACCYDAQGNLAFALGDGSLALITQETLEPLSLPAHRGACLSLAPAPEEGFVSGGDDGRLVQLSPEGRVTELRHCPGRWIDHVASHPSGLIACSAGKMLYLRRPDGSELELQHPSSIGGLCFSPDGRQIAVSHYGGVSLHYTLAVNAKPRLLKWTGSHLAVTWSPDGRFVLTCMQENCVRGWRLKDPDDLHMSGFPARVKSWSWLGNGHWLATAASDCVPCWPFRKRSGPMGEMPLTLGGREHARVTAVAGDPRNLLLAVGYDDGMVLVSELDEEREIPRSIVIKPPGQGAVSSMVFADHGRALAIGTSQGLVGIMPMA
jgi:WD40 repeat protein